MSASTGVIERSAEEEIVLEVEDVDSGYGDVQVLDQLSMSLAKDEIA